MFTLINILVLFSSFICFALLVDLGAGKMGYMLNFVDLWIIFYI